MKAAAAANNAALALYRQLADNEGDLFYSPYSIYTALMMATPELLVRQPQ